MYCRRFAFSLSFKTTNINIAKEEYLAKLGSQKDLILTNEKP